MCYKVYTLSDAIYISLLEIKKRFEIYLKHNPYKQTASYKSQTIVTYIINTYVFNVKITR